MELVTRWAKIENRNTEIKDAAGKEVTDAYSMGRVKDFEISAVYSPVGFKPKTIGWDMPRVLCGQFPRAQSLYRKKKLSPNEH